MTVDTWMFFDGVSNNAFNSAKDRTELLAMIRAGRRLGVFPFYVTAHDEEGDLIEALWYDR